MTLYQQHCQKLLNIVLANPNGINSFEIMSQTELKPSQLSVAAAGLIGSKKIEKYKIGSRMFGYRAPGTKQQNTNIPARREAIPMHALEPYMGEKPTHRVSL